MVYANVFKRFSLRIFILIVLTTAAIVAIVLSVSLLGKNDLTDRWRYRRNTYFLIMFQVILVALGIGSFLGYR
jgi:hypothetical protein